MYLFKKFLTISILLSIGGFAFASCQPPDVSEKERLEKLALSITSMANDSRKVEDFADIYCVYVQQSSSGGGTSFADAECKQLKLRISESKEMTSRLLVLLNLSETRFREAQQCFSEKRNQEAL